MADSKGAKKGKSRAKPKKAQAKKAPARKARPKKARPEEMEAKEMEAKEAEPNEAEAKEAEPRAAEPAEPEKEAAAAPLPSIREAVGWIGTPVDDSSGQRLGKVTGIHADANSNEPKWLVVRLGTFAGEAAVPFEHTAEGAGRVWVAYKRDEVRNSPKLNAEQALNAGQELQLCEHYGIRIGIGRAAELAEREDDEISAVPAK